MNGDLDAFVRSADATLREAALRDALKKLLERYVDLVNCGDCGLWNPEEEDEVIAARAALTTATEAKEPPRP